MLFDIALIVLGGVILILLYIAITDNTKLKNSANRPTVTEEPALPTIPIIKLTREERLAIYNKQRAQDAKTKAYTAAELLAEGMHINDIASKLHYKTVKALKENMKRYGVDGQMDYCANPGCKNMVSEKEGAFAMCDNCNGRVSA